MTNDPNDRLPDLAFLPTGTAPKDRRAALERTMKDRRATIGNAVSNGAVLALCVAFSLFYGAISAFAWIMRMHPACGVLFSIFSAAMLASSVRLAMTFKEQLDRVVAVPERLRREAEAEAAIEAAMLDANLKAIFWNDMARAAKANDVGESIVNALRAQRGAIERRQTEVADNLRRYLAVTAPEPDAVPPTDDWGPIETIDLTTRADS